MLKIKALAIMTLLISSLTIPKIAEARIETQVDCAYTISQTWVGKCRVNFGQTSTVITTSNGHTIRIKHRDWLQLNTNNRVTIDGSSGMAYWNASQCEFWASKSNNSFSVELFGRGVCL